MGAQRRGGAASGARDRDLAQDLTARQAGPDLFDSYGLAPHQQPADIYYGPGYEVRGGWNWYTGAAARMLIAAYAILGLRLENGNLVLPQNAFAADRELRLLKVDYRGQELRQPASRQRAMADLGAERPWRVTGSSGRKSSSRAGVSSSRA